MSKVNGGSAGEFGQGVRQTAQQASPVITALGRFGYAAEGLVYGLIGILAAQVALGHGGATTDNKGALTRIAQAPFGSFLLIAIALGFVGYACWRFLEAALDPEGNGKDAKGIAKRIGYALTGGVHLAFAVSAVRLLQTGDAGATSDAAAKSGTAQLLAKPFGQWLVAIAGLCVLGMAGFQFYRAAKAEFRKHARIAEMSSQEERGYTILGRVGYAARGFVFAAIGLFLIIAARNANPAEARGLDSTLAIFATQPFGSWLLGAVAVGFIAYGLFLLAEARYHRIQIT
ncbi:MAG TPA: DUF1206 domain-containing protein [Thermomicrobiales bacterium]|jgi:hypothetical protein